ncbi:MAG: hypothetical protein ACREX6_02365 [Casimicrobiaceae bacterium]
MNPLLRDPLLRYASLAGAGLPMGERHKARAVMRQHAHAAIAGGDLDADVATRVLADLALSASGDCASVAVFDGDASPADARNRGAPARRKPRRLTLLTY